LTDPVDQEPDRTSLLDDELPVCVTRWRRDEYRFGERPADRREPDGSVAARGSKCEKNYGRERRQMRTWREQVTPPGSMWSG
jgi:hypothetical protein